MKIQYQEHATVSKHAPDPLFQESLLLTLQPIKMYYNLPH